MEKTIGLLVLVTMVCSVASAETITFKNGDAGFDGNRDSFVRADKGNLNFGAYNDICVGAESSSEIMKGLSHWDLGAVPTGLTIQSAKLGLYARDLQGSGDRTVYVNAMLLPVNMGDNNVTQADAGEVCWNYRAYDDTNWGGSSGPEAGTDYTTTNGTSLVINPSQNGSYVEFDVTAIVNAWYTGALTNNGFLLYGDDWDGADARNNFCSVDTNEGSGNECYPYLTIEYTPEPATMSLLALGGLAMLKRRKSA